MASLRGPIRRSGMHWSTALAGLYEPFSPPVRCLITGVFNVTVDSPLKILRAT